MKNHFENITIARNIRKIRDIKGYSQEFMAQKMELSQSAYSKIEQGKTAITNEVKEKIATVLGVNKELLENYNDNMIFSYCNQSGNIGNNHTYNYNMIEKLEAVYAELLAEKNAHIRALEMHLNKDKK